VHFVGSNCTLKSVVFGGTCLSVFNMIDLNGVNCTKTVQTGNLQKSSAVGQLAALRKTGNALIFF
jgi:hypothetical protein